MLFHSVNNTHSVRRVNLKSTTTARPQLVRCVWLNPFVTTDYTRDSIHEVVRSQENWKLWEFLLKSSNRSDIWHIRWWHCQNIRASRIPPTHVWQVRDFTWCLGNTYCRLVSWGPVQTQSLSHDDIKLKHFPRYWPFLRGIHRSQMNSPRKGQWQARFHHS